MTKSYDRRSFLKALGITGAGVLIGSAMKGPAAFALDACDKVDSKATAAMMVKALKYVPVSKTKGQKCEGCVQYKVSADNKKIGQCTILQGCTVASTGWCASWSKKT
jgi:hypothetical protein